MVIICFERAQKRVFENRDLEKLNAETPNVNHKVQNLIKMFDDLEIVNLATSICESSDSNKMWKLFNDFKKRNKDVEEPCTPLRLIDNSLTSSDCEKSQEFARYLRSVHQTPDNPIFDGSFKKEIDGIIKSAKSERCDSGCIKDINVKKFKELLQLTKANSAPGEDEITYDLLKTCSDECIQKLCVILNKCLKENVFPNAWKKAKVIMVPKPGRDHNIAANHRPISLLSCLGKIFERYIYEHLMSSLTGKNFFNKTQAGFCKGRSSQEHLFRLTQDVLNGFKERKCTIGLFLDVQAAFDAVWKNGLKYKIKQIGLNKQLENLLISFLDNRTLSVYVNGIISELVTLEAGTPQGSCLSPILYLIFVNDMPLEHDEDKLSSSQFADDVGMWATHQSLKSSANIVQDGVQILENWCRKWQVTLNPLKSKLVVFTKCPRHKVEENDNPINICLFGQSIPVCQEADFLGMTFDSRLTWEAQTRKMQSRAYSRLNLLRAVSYLSTKPNPNLLVNLYKSTIRSIFEYCSVGIISAAEVHMEKLQVLQNQALRVILRVPAYISIKDLHDASGLMSIKEHLVGFAKSRLMSLRKSSPLIAKSILSFNRVKHIQTNMSPLDVLGY